jgi:hypothetical protein
MENDMDTKLLDNAEQIARSTISVIDAVVQRGAIKGEELSTIGALRDQCVVLSHQVEAARAENESE